jgi:hypothetical protein
MSSSSEHHSNASADAWEVIDVLAERKNSSGSKELLVVWKPTWILKSQMDQAGPSMQKWRKTALQGIIVKVPDEDSSMTDEANSAGIACAADSCSKRPR